MKRKTSLHKPLFTVAAGFLLGGAAHLAAQLPEVRVQEGAAEIVVTADFTVNGLPDIIVVDRVSGAYRFGRQNPAGVITWEEPRGSGVADVTSATAGRVLSPGRHVLVVTSPDTNRLQIIDPLNTILAPHGAGVPGRIGPLSVATGQLEGTHAREDFAVATSLNDSSLPYSLGFYENLGSASLILPDPAHVTDSTFRHDQLKRVSLSGSLNSTIGYLEIDDTQACLRVASMNEPGPPVTRLSVCGLAADTRYELVRFGGAAIGTLLTFVPGERVFTRRSLSASGSDFIAGSPQNFPTPFPLGGLTAVSGGGETWLALLSEDGMEIAVHEFDGTAPGALIQTLDAPSPAEPFTAAVSMGNGEGLLVLRGGTGGGSDGADFYAWDAGGGQFSLENSQDFPSIAPRSGMANVTLMTGEPFVDVSARPLSLRHARDWTSGPPPSPPANVEVAGERFQSENLGLGDPQNLNLGPFVPSSTYALLNQYADPVSIFTLSRASGAMDGQVSVSPQPGLYDRSIELRFTANPASLTIWFRDAGGTWQVYADPGPEPNPTDAVYPGWFSQFSNLVRFQETTIEYFGVTPSGRATPIRRAHYRFTQPPDTLSSLGDGVPDYAKLGLGLNPFRLPDGDAGAGIGNSLQSILDGSGIPARWLSGSAVDVYVRPLSDDGTGNPLAPSRLATDPPETLPDGTVYGGNQIFARTLSGALVGQGRDPIPATIDRNEGLGIYPPFPEPSALLTSLSGEHASVFVVSTRPNYALAGTLPTAPAPSSVGRELIGLLPLTGISWPSYSRAFTGGTLTAEANAWRAGAEAFHNSQPPPVVAETLDATETLAALLFERWLQTRMVARGLLSGDFTPTTPDAGNPPAFNPNFLTLTSHRTREGARPMSTATSGAVSPVEEALREISRWAPSHAAHNPATAAAAIRQTTRDSADPGVAALRDVARDVYRISAAHGNAFPGALEPPVDVLRRFIATGALPEPYAPGFSDLAGAPFTSLPASTYAGAVNGIPVITASPAARPSSLLLLEFRADSLDTPGCLVVNEVFFPSTLYSLFNPDGEAFRLPANFRVLPGTRLEARVFTDAPFAACVGTSLEVIELGGVPLAEIALLPSASGEDTDGNLLGDEWEQAFFGDTGADPWADLNGDGYTNLQKYLDGKDPFVFASYSANPPADLHLPVLLIEPAGPGQARITFQFPEPYAGALIFQLFADMTLAGSWTPAPQAITSPSPGNFEVVVPTTVEDKNFWRVGLSLK